MNGADDVLKYRKWESACPQRRMITMSRPGFDAELTEQLRAAGMPAAGTTDFVRGPEMPDCSRSIPHRTFSRAVWRLYGGAKCLVVWY